MVDAPLSGVMAESASVAFATFSEDELAADQFVQMLRVGEEVRLAAMSAAELHWAARSSAG